MRILHFSDFHLSKDGIKESHQLVDRMLDCLAPLNRKKKFDLIVFTGDMVDKGGSSFGNIKTAYDTFRTEVIDRLCDGLGIPTSAFYVCPGNHEVNRFLIDTKKDVELETELTTNVKLSQYLISGRNPGFNERLKDYDTYFRQGWLEDVSSNHDVSVNLADHFVVEADGRKVGISCLNSAWRCGKKVIIVPGNTRFERIINSIARKFIPELREKCKQEKELENTTLIGADQVTGATSFFRNQQNEISGKLALVHHHYTLLGQEESKNMNKILRKHYDLCFFGHTHCDDEDKVSNPHGEMISAIAPGMIRWNVQESGNYSNGFSVWDIDFSRNTATQRNFIQKDGVDFKLNLEFGKYGSYDWTIGKGFVVMPLSDFISLKLGVGMVSMDSPELQEMRKRILHQVITNKGDLILYGVPGIGKTFMLMTAFEYSDNRVFYCGIGKVIDQIRDQLIQLFSRKDEKDYILIFDNCTIDTLDEVLDLRDEFNSSVRVIGAMNVYDEKKLKTNTLPIEELTPQLVKSAITTFVDERIQDYNLRETIKRYADGFPLIAIKLVEQVQKGSEELHSDINMMRKLIRSFGDSVVNSENLQELLQVMSLFQPFPKLDEDSMAIWKMKSLSTLHDKSRDEIVTLIEQAKKIWHGTLLENSLSGYSVRPFGLAVYLANQWFENHKNDNGFENLLSEISNLPDTIRNTVIACLSARLQHLGESESARTLFSKLTQPNGFFRCENVVLSDLGSQLILAIADVNPKELSAALKSVLSDITSKRIREIGWSGRRNIVWTLTRLAYYEESFDDAITSLALLASEETEEGLSNNATGIFRQLFHIFLPGTKASLSQRIEWLEKYFRDNNSIKPLLPVAMRGVLASGHFMRTGNVGPENRENKDYTPSKYFEIEDYWARASVLISEDLDEGNNSEEYAAIVKDNLHLWARNNTIKWVLPLIKVIAIKGKGNLKILQNDFDSVAKCLTGDTLEEFKSLQSQLVSNDIISRLKSRQQDYYEQEHKRFDTEDEVSFFDETAKEFIKSGEYCDKKVWDEILDNREIVFWAFCMALNNCISLEQLRGLYNAVCESKAFSDSLISPFLLTFCSMTRDKKATKDFIEEVGRKEYNKLYVRLKARTEDDDLTNFFLLDSKYAKSGFRFIPIYLEHVSLTTKNQIPLLEKLTLKLDEAKNEIIHYVVTHYQFVEFTESALSCCKQIISAYEINDNSRFHIQEYGSFCIRLLRTVHDDDFAKTIIGKFLNAPYTAYDSYPYTELFRYLLSNYQKVTLPILLDAFGDDSGFLSVGGRLATDLGSGMGFGVGDFFKLDKDLLLSKLEDKNLYIARIYARICPIFENENNSEGVFSEWVILLLDKYGENKEVRTNLDLNMGCFMWSGSVIPLFDKKIKCFESLINHAKPEVREWAESNIRQLKAERMDELIREDFSSKLN